MGGKLYMGMTTIRKGMTDNDAQDVGGPNAMRIPENKCGCVYEFDVDSSTYRVTTMKGLICGTPVSSTSCDVAGIANPDNVAAMHGHHKLLIGEDTSMHNNNIMWLYDLQAKALVGRIASTPQGAEVCSPYFYPDVGGFSYITMVLQHPTSYGPSALGYVAWKRDCTVSYPNWAMPGTGAATTCTTTTTLVNSQTSAGFQDRVGLLAMLSTVVAFAAA